MLARPLPNSDNRPLASAAPTPVVAEEAVSTVAPPKPTSLRDVRLEIPRHLLDPDHTKAATSMVRVLVQVVVATAFAVFVWRRGWWPLFPVSWVIGSIAATALFVAGHDCGHGSFLRSRRAMQVVGHLTLSPVLYPFWSWKYSHDAHHRHTNDLDLGDDGVYFDNAWNPHFDHDWRELRQTSPASAWIYRLTRALPPLGSFLHMLAYHWRPTAFRAGRHRRRVLLSIAVTVVTAVAITALIWSTLGSPWAVLHVWLIPAILFHHWMALYTYLHHTAEDVTFLRGDEWTPFAAQMEGTVNVLAPRWLSYLHLAIDVHIPHHVSTRIPSYHLRDANDALLAGSWGHVMRERPLRLGYLRDQVRACHLWSAEQRGYRRFRSGTPEPGQFQSGRSAKR